MEEKLTKKQQKDLVLEIQKDFKRRKEERKIFEEKWKLNLNFLIGNQNLDLNMSNMIFDSESNFAWEEKKVFNHIAPIIETRLSRLVEVKPSMVVLPASAQDEDVSNAKVCRDILEGISSKINLSKIISKATSWSEVCGTAFYKVVWNKDDGMVIGKNENGENIFEGDVDVLVCSPFEIYPESGLVEEIEEQKSIMHAKTCDVQEIYEAWGVKVLGSDVESFSLAQNFASSNAFSISKTIKHNEALVIEKYEKPTKKYPDGRLIIVCENELLYYGKLPYKNMHNEKRGYPFVKQISISEPTMFWGTSVIERLIPIQKAYNSVKNRKHEFMKRASLGVLAVEDGSVDVESLEEEGLAPGKVLVYRQGSNLPSLISEDSVPTSFEQEERALLDEFLSVGGISDIFGGENSKFLTTMSGTALEILIEQEYSRISSIGENIKFATKKIAEQILRLYKQFVAGKRETRLVGNNGKVNFFYWDKGTISSDDVTFDTQAENLRSLSQKRNTILELLDKGIFNDENGKLKPEMKLKLLDTLGFGLWEESLDLDAKQTQKAQRENMELISENIVPKVLDIFDHQKHIEAHTAFMLSEEFEKNVKKKPEFETIMLNHINEHKKFLEKTLKEQQQKGE